MTIPPVYDELGLDVSVLPGFPDVHEAYRMLRDQKDMVCGVYALAYLLRAFGVTEDAGPATVDRIAEIAGTALEPHNAKRLEQIENELAAGDLPEERASTWAMHDYFHTDLTVVEDEGGTSVSGLIDACREISDGRVEAIPLPAAADGTVQLDAPRFGAVLSGLATGELPAQPILNYNLTHTLAPAGLLGHKYNLVSLLTRWDDPEYFRTLDRDIGHFTTVAAHVARTNSDRRYVVVRDSYRSFGWDGYHLQPESYLRRGLVRPEDEREGGMLLVTPAADAVYDWLSSHDLVTSTWDNGSAYVRYA